MYVVPFTFNISIKFYQQQENDKTRYQTDIETALCLLIFNKSFLLSCVD